DGWIDQTELPRLFEHGAREGAAAVGVRRHRNDALFVEPTGGLDERFLFLGQLKVEHARKDTLKVGEALAFGGERRAWRTRAACGRPSAPERTLGGGVSGWVRW